MKHEFNYVSSFYCPPPDSNIIKADVSIPFEPNKKFGFDDTAVFAAHCGLSNKEWQIRAVCFDHNYGEEQFILSVFR